MTTFSELERAHEAKCHEIVAALKQGRTDLAKTLGRQAVRIMAQLEAMRERSGGKLQVLDFELTPG